MGRDKRFFASSQHRKGGCIEVVLEIKNLTLSVPGFELGPVDLQVDRGEFFAVIGATGSGKSMLLETIMGILPENRLSFGGSISWEGRDITGDPPEKRRFGIVYQDLALFPHLKVVDNILYGVRYNQALHKTAAEKLKWLVDRFQIGHILHRYPWNLSGGERQRVALARVLILEPRLIMLDEPLSALDPIFRREIRQLLQDIHRELGITFIMVSHDFNEVRSMAGSVAVLSHGKVVAVGPVEQVFEEINVLFG